MTDSERAASLTRGADLPIGLHLNLSEPFTGSDLPDELRARHNRVCSFLRRNKYALILFHPFLADDFAAVVEAQFAEFARLYGREPAHVDGHQHMHLCTNMLWQKLLPKGARVRRSFTFGHGQKSGLNRWYRSRVDAALARRHRLTDHFFSLSQQLGGSRLGTVIELARESSVELMVHPAWKHEYEFLMSDTFAELLIEATLPASQSRAA